MAKNMKDTAKDAKAGKGHNAKNRDPEHVKKKVKEAVALMVPEEKKKTEANEELKKIRRDLKSETGITAKDFDFARRLAEMEDEDEQKEKMWNMSVAFEALSNGQQMNFLDAMEGDV